MTPEAKSLTVAGVDTAVEIRPGRYYFETKARLEKEIESHLSVGARRLWALSRSFSMFYKRELCAKDKAGKSPVTVGDFSRLLDLDEANTRKYLDECQAAGVMERRAKDGGRLRKAQVQIYSYAEPRNVPKPDRDSGSAQPENAGWIPDKFSRILAYAKRRRLHIPDNLTTEQQTAFLERAERAERLLIEAENACEALFLAGDGAAVKIPVARNGNTGSAHGENRLRASENEPIKSRGVKESEIKERSSSSSPSVLMDPANFQNGDEEENPNGEKRTHSARPASPSVAPLRGENENPEGVNGGGAKPLPTDAPGISAAAGAAVAVETLPAVYEPIADPPPGDGVEHGAAAAADPPPPNWSHVPTFEEIAAQYPGEVDPASSTLFQALPLVERQALIRSMPGYRACGRWQERRFIPRLSRFIREKWWNFEPPAAFAPAVVNPKLEKFKQDAAVAVHFSRRFRGLK